MTSQNSRPAPASIGPPRARCRSVSSWVRLRSSRSARSTRPSRHRPVSRSGTGSPLRTVAIRKIVPWAARYPSRASEAASSMDASSATVTTRRPWWRSCRARRVSSNSATVLTCPSGPGWPSPAASRLATAPSGSSHGGPAAGHMLGRVTAGRRPLEALVGQPGLPDPGGAVYQQAGALARAQGRFENFQLRATADEGPPRQRDRHSSQHDSSARIYKPARPGQAVTTAGRRPPTIPTMWSDRWRGTPSPSRVAYRWAAARSKWAPVMPSPWWAAAMSGPR